MSIRTATLTNVSASATSVALFAAVEPNAADMRIIHNDSTSVLFVKYGATASATSYTHKLEAGDHLEFPKGGPKNEIYTGVVHGIWTTATGTARCTEAV